MTRLSRGVRILPVALVATAMFGAVPGKATTYEEVARLTGPDRQKILEDGARKEGEVVWYTALVAEVMRPVLNAYEKKYPFVKVKFVRADTADTLQRVMAERRANSVRVDVMDGGSDALKISGAAQPFESPVVAGYPRHHVDADKTWVSTRSSWQGIAWNTKMVGDADAPRTWEALLDPKWKGKIAWGSSPATGAPRLITHFRKIWGDQKARDYLLKLKAQEPRTLPGSIRAVLDQIIAGEMPIGISMAMHHIAISKDKGAPIDGTSPEPVLTRSDAVSFVKGAPHPHAGMLLIDFLLSADDGQAALRDAQYNPAHPAVKPLPILAWIQPSLIGKQEILLSPEEEADYAPASNDLYKELFR